MSLAKNCVIFPQNSGIFLQNHAFSPISLVPKIPKKIRKSHVTSSPVLWRVNTSEQLQSLLSGSFIALMIMVKTVTNINLSLFQILFIAGLSFVIGLERTFRFFFQRHKLKATGFFLGGIFIVLFGWPVIGMCVEAYGFFLLFR